MGEFEKTLNRLRAAPPLANFNDVRRVFEHFGWEQKRQKGSHVIFTKKGDRPFSIRLMADARSSALMCGNSSTDWDWMTRMTTIPRPTTLEGYLALAYPLDVIADPDGGYVIVYRDLPGCMTQVETLEEVPAAAREIRELWIESEWEDEAVIPLPSYPEEYSGRFNVRLAKSLHRRLAESAEREGVSLNTYVATLLERNDALARVEARFETINRRLGDGPTPPPSRDRRRRTHATTP